MEKRPGQKHLYVVKDPVTDDPKRLSPVCVTCELDQFVGIQNRELYYANCTRFGASVNPSPEEYEDLDNPSRSESYYVLFCEGPGLPLAGLHSSKTHKLHRILFDFRIQRAEILSQLAMPKRRTFEVPLPQGWRAQVQLLLPPSWREELKKAKFPVLVEVNGRPGSESVSDRFNIDWGTYMASHNDIVYVKLDVRGSRGQGKRALYRKIGGVEVQDQLAVLRHLIEKHTYLAADRIGLWGWGYGGYVTSMVLGNQQNVFKCGAAVNPIADWLYYSKK